MPAFDESNPVNTLKTVSPSRAIARVRAAKKIFFRLQKSIAHSENGVANAHAETWFCMMLAWHSERPQMSSGYDIISVGSHIH